MGTFDVSLKAVNVAGENTLLKSGYITVGISGISQINDMDGIRIFPNPNKGQFTLQIQGSDNNLVKILDQLGKVVFETEVNQKTSILSPSGITPGIYILRVTGSRTGETKSSKLIIQ